MDIQKQDMLLVKFVLQSLALLSILYLAYWTILETLFVLFSYLLALRLVRPPRPRLGLEYAE